MALPSLHPFDVVLASTRLYSSLPVVGRHLEPFAGLTAMALYGGHYAPSAMRAAINRRSGAAAAPANDMEAVVDTAVDLAEQTRGSRVPPFLRAGAQRRRCL
jgi:hypothetical protein